MAVRRRTRGVRAPIHSAYRELFDSGGGVLVDIDVGSSRVSDVRVIVSSSFPDDWDDVVASAPGGGHRQTTAWAAVQSVRGWQASAVDVEVAGRSVARAMVVSRRVGAIATLAYIAGGPLPVHPGSVSSDLIAKSLEILARQINASVLVVDPPVGDDDLVAAMSERRFSSTPFLISLPATVRVDVSQDDEALLAAMKSKVRYNIRKGLRMGAVVREGTSDDVPTLHRLISHTADRQGFSAPPLDHVRAMHDLMAECGSAKMFIAEVDDDPVAALLTIPWGDTVVYKRGGWSGEAGEYRPNEVLHWAAMRWARDNGYRFYDFDGIDGHLVPIVLSGEPIPEADRQSVSRFKLGFGGTPEMRPPVLSYVPNPVLRFCFERWLPRLVDLEPFRRLEAP